MTDVKKNKKVTWNTPQGPTHGKVVKKVGDDKFQVKSAKSGKTAEHKGDSLGKKQ